jgi:hypothetical protein
MFTDHFKSWNSFSIIQISSQTTLSLHSLAIWLKDSVLCVCLFWDWTGDRRYQCHIGGSNWWVYWSLWSTQDDNQDVLEQKIVPRQDGLPWNNRLYPEMSRFISDKSPHLGQIESFRDKATCFGTQFVQGQISCPVIISGVFVIKLFYIVASQSFTSNPWNEFGKSQDQGDNHGCIGFLII